MTTILLLLAACSLQAADERASVDEFDIAGFSANREIALWLVAYDRVAWKTSDEVMSAPEEQRTGLGREWFCYQDNEQRWHAVFGKYHPETDHYDAPFHFLYEEDGPIERLTTTPDTSYARALHHALAWMDANLEGPRMNTYIRRDPQGHYQVWFLPVMHHSGAPISGIEASVLLDASGTKVLEKRVWQDRVMGYPPNREATVTLKQPDQVIPTVGALFFLIYHGHLFDTVNIDNQKFRTTVIRAAGKVSWVHVALPIK